MSAPPPVVVSVNPRQQFTNTITTALGTVAALMWAEAIKSLFNNQGVFARFTTYRMAPWWIAIIATLLAVFGSRAVVALSEKAAKLRLPILKPKTEDPQKT